MTIWDIYVWFIGICVSICIILLAYAIVGFIGAMIITLTSKLCLLLKTTYAKVLSKAG